MHIPDLALLVAFLTTVMAAMRVGWNLRRGPSAAARRIATRWGIGAACYFGLLLAVSLLQPGRTIPLGENECFDDWCIAVDGMERASADRIVVAVRLSNRGRGRPQAEPDAYVYLTGDAGLVVQASTPFDGSVGGVVPAGESRAVRVAFDVSPDFVARGLVKQRRSRFPATIIIGDPSSLLHRPTVHLLAASDTSAVSLKSL